jgi:hypothetical protein
MIPDCKRTELQVLYREFPKVKSPPPFLGLACAEYVLSCKYWGCITVRTLGCRLLHPTCQFSENSACIGKLLLA